MATISDLLRYKDSLDLLNPKNGKKLATVWIRVLGDEDIQEAYKAARVASSRKRKSLKDISTADYQDQVESLDEQDRTDLVDLILASRESDFARESVTAVVREELPVLEDIAEDADTPSLEEQEELDADTEDVNERFRKGVDNYVETKKVELKTELDSLPDDQILKMAREEFIKILALQEFANELNDQKGYRGTFKEKECKNKAFESIQDFKEAHSDIKTQIIIKYQSIELGADEIKN